ncbi:hypothetical protein [Peteryoungia ipomoeae]|uniref:Transmembrane protein n=1 Tax=Peteryoungia ipomoeae TaxID=1210932 RepID=A0A4S8P7M6_9HYPH|nr:hypothetical protein [Peteryoungia ipomoeae]THV25621.1 hypothetical protein FAA97_05405 [Peteryoungia ipomoeae]
MTISSEPAGLMPIESAASAVSFKSVIAGALAASAVTLVFTLIGTGLGLGMISPYPSENSSLSTIGVAAVIWLLVAQWVSAGVGGYLTGRLRTKWVGVRTDEVFFRDTAHGFLGWALSTLIVAGLLSSVVGSIVNTGTQITGAAAGTAIAAGAGTAAASSDGSSDFSLDYFTDSLLRPANPATPPSAQGDERVTAEVSRILVNGAMAGDLPEGDRDYIEQVIASRTGLSEADASARLDQTLAAIETARNEAQAAADAAKKAATTGALVSAAALMIGAFISAVAAAFGGRQRDEEEDLMIVG